MWQQRARGPAAAEGAAEAPAHIVRARELLAAGDELDATVVGANSGGVLVSRRSRARRCSKPCASTHDGIRLAAGLILSGVVERLYLSI